MNKEINLLLKKSAKDPKNEKKIRSLRLISMGILFLVGSVSMFLFMLLTFSPLTKLKAQESALLFEMNTLHPQVAKLSLTKARAEDVDKILTTRSYFDQTIDTIKNQQSESMTLDTVKMDKGIATLSLTTTSLDTVEDFISKLRQLSTEKKTFGNITLTKVSLNSLTSDYKVDVDVTLL